MLEYAKIHGIEFASFFDRENPDSFHCAITASGQSRVAYIIALLEQLEEPVYEFAVGAIGYYMDNRSGVMKEAPAKPKWSILWGLFTRW